MGLNRLPYHLRPNKAAERFSFIEAIGRLEKLGIQLEEYTYYGLGGSFLEDCRLIYEFFPQVKMVSIEENGNIVSCQEFHRPCGTQQLTLEHTDLSSFIGLYGASDQKSIFWLDYTGLDYSCFQDFKALLPKIAVNSMVKITLRADTRDYWGSNRRIRHYRVESFRKKFGAVMPNLKATPPFISEDFAYLLQQMLQLAAQQALPPNATPSIFQPISSFYYSDGTGMFTLTGIACLRDDVTKVQNAYSGWSFANLTWNRPTAIDIPILSTKERLHLQQYLPCSPPAGNILRTQLGYLIGDDIPQTESALEQYAVFHRYSPYFIKGIP